MSYSTGIRDPQWRGNPWQTLLPTRRPTPLFGRLQERHGFVWSVMRRQPLIESSSNLACRVSTSLDIHTSNHFWWKMKSTSYKGNTPPKEYASLQNRKHGTRFHSALKCMTLIDRLYFPVGLSNGSLNQFTIKFRTCWTCVNGEREYRSQIRSWIALPEKYVS